MSRRSKYIILTAVVSASVLVVLFVLGLNNQMVIRVYTVETEKLGVPVRIALVTDLHSCDYGQGQTELLSAVAGQSPDLVLLSGDIVDDAPRMDAEKAYEAVRALASRWPTYYVTGNHEFWSGEAQEIKAQIAACGATVLSGAVADVSVNGEQLLVAGIDDPAVGEAAWSGQLATVSEAVEAGEFALLLSHRPERTDAYRDSPFDLVLAGHAHGGQWRIPGLLNGLLAPNQGLFPKYAGGLYDIGGVKLAVSRGLARESTRMPRLYNPPELVMIDLIPIK